MRRVSPRTSVIDFEPYQINISISTSINAGGWHDSSESITTYHVNIEMTDHDNFEKREKIGGAICYYINGYSEGTEKFINIREATDAVSGDLLASVAPVINEDGRLSDEYIGSNILYVDHYFIAPEYRGKGIGKLCFPAILDTLGRNAGVVTIIPCPTEDNGKDRIEESDKRYKRIMNRMIKFYKGFGFTQVSEDVWVQDTSLRY